MTDCFKLLSKERELNYKKRKLMGCYLKDCQRKINMSTRCMRLAGAYECFYLHFRYTAEIGISVLFLH